MATSKQLIDYTISDDEKLFLHGGNLEDMYDKNNKRIAYGVGLYVTTSYRVVQNYIKG